MAKTSQLGLCSKGEFLKAILTRKASDEEQLINLITTRIIRLKGLELSKNLGDPIDTFKRYIYIHGTNHEERLGQPFSNGCIELSNQGCLELFSQKIALVTIFGLDKLNPLI